MLQDWVFVLETRLVLMYNFISRLLGWTCCGDWSKWEVKQSNFTRPCDVEGGVHFIKLEKNITFTKTWQERTCLKCGKVQQSSLNY